MICNLCPRQCRALRTETEGAGICGVPALPQVARAALHMWEEPPISGTRGSGTIFFSGCPLRCVFCQNDQISRQAYGRPVTVERVREMCLELAAQGAHNINFVTPTHYAHVIAQVLQQPLPVPVVWNTGGYERLETLRSLEGKVDIYLPDLKYIDPADALRYSDAEDYVETAKAAILEMYRQTGPVQMEDGLMKKGVIIRHLILPGKAAAAKEIMDWVAESFPKGAVLFSLMSQYLPWGRVKEGQYPELNRTLRKGELRSVQNYMENLGLEGFTQQSEAAESEYIPPFDLTGV